MTQQGGSEGHLLAVLGAAMLIAGLWLPWYSFHIPPEAIQEATQAAGPYAGLVQQGAAILSSLGPIHLTAWNVATAIPAFLLVVGVVGGGLSLLTVIGMADGAGKIVSRVALPAIVLVIYRIVSPPGGSASDLLHPAYGIWIALAGAVIILVGGAVASSGESVRGVARFGARAEQPVYHAPPSYYEPPDPDWPRTQSVPPPR